jgi:hypothetical protein
MFKGQNAHEECSRNIICVCVYMCSTVTFYAKYFIRIRAYEVGFEKNK